VLGGSGRGNLEDRSNLAGAGGPGLKDDVAIDPHAARKRQSTLSPHCIQLVLQYIHLTS
jgi:hypothetical protein